MADEDLQRILDGVAAGSIPPLEAAGILLPLIGGGTVLTGNGEVRVDLDRERRCRFPEVVYGPGKSPETIVEIFRCQQARGQTSLATRVSETQSRVLMEQFPQAIANVRAKTVRLLDEETVPIGKVIVLTAGTSDLPVAEEALETLAWTGVGHELITDCGVAGPQRLLQQIPRLQSADVLIVVAGMEGTLPSVVGGWTDCPVIAVPTSVGYGTSFQGLTALLGMLNSCAANVAVVNIDAGFKAGYLAGLMTHRVYDPGLSSPQRGRE